MHTINLPLCGLLFFDMTSVNSADRKRPRVALGLMTFGPPGTESSGTRISSLSTFNACLDSFQRAGYSELDTARTYNDGHQEAWTARANYQSRAMPLATKWWPYIPGDHSPDKIRNAIETSLKELDTGCLDIWYLHAPDRATSFQTTLQAVDELYREGKFRKLGLSNYAAWEVAEIWNIADQRDWVKPSVYQAMYNCLTRSIEEELIPCCRKYGIDIMVYNVLAGGVLSGRYKSKEVPDDGGRYSDSDPVVGAAYRARYFKDTNFEALTLIRPVIEQHGLSLIEVAYRWCLYHSKLRVGGVANEGNDGIVIGVSSLEQMEANLMALDGGRLPEDVVRALDLGWEITKADCASYRLKEFYDAA